MTDGARFQPLTVSQRMTCLPPWVIGFLQQNAGKSTSLRDAMDSNYKAHRSF